MLHSFYPIFLFIIILSTIEVKSARFLHQSTSVYECLLLFTSQSIWNIFPISGSSLVLCPYFFSLLVFIRASCIHSHTRRQDRDEGDDTVHNDSRQSHIYIYARNVWMFTTYLRLNEKLWQPPSPNEKTMVNESKKKKRWSKKELNGKCI